MAGLAGTQADSSDSKQARPSGASRALKNVQEAGGEGRVSFKKLEAEHACRERGPGEGAMLLAVSDLWAPNPSRQAAASCPLRREKALKRQNRIIGVF